MGLRASNLLVPAVQVYLDSALLFFFLLLGVVDNVLSNTYIEFGLEDPLLGKIATTKLEALELSAPCHGALPMTRPASRKQKKSSKAGGMRM